MPHAASLAAPSFAEPSSQSMGASVGDYLALLKPRVMSLVVFTGFVGLMIAPGHLHPALAAIALLCIAVGAGASAALNMWFDADIDVLMARTRGRPIPQGRIVADEALAFGSVLAFFSVFVMGVAINAVAAELLALTIGFYLFVYTMWLKRRTPQNIVIGGAAGALPPVIGWAAVTGSVSLEPIVLFLIIFLWTPPHFWALAIYREGDYAKAGVPMLPVVAGIDSTCRHIVAYSVVLVAVSLAPLALGFAGAIYGALAIGLGAVFIALSIELWRARGDEVLRNAKAKRLFGFSLGYLTALFVALLIERFV